MTSFTVTEEQLATLMGKYGGSAGEATVTTRRRLNPRHMKPNGFGGDMNEWSDWAFSSKRSIRAAGLIERIERLNTEPNEEELNEWAENSKYKGNCSRSTPVIV